MNIDEVARKIRMSINQHRLRCHDDATPTLAVMGLDTCFEIENTSPVRFTRLSGEIGHDPRPPSDGKYLVPGIPVKTDVAMPSNVIRFEYSDGSTDEVTL